MQGLYPSFYGCYHSYISIETTPGLHPQAGLNGSDRAAEQADSLQKILYPNKHLTREHADWAEWYPATGQVNSSWEMGIFDPKHEKHLHSMVPNMWLKMPYQTIKSMVSGGLNLNGGWSLYLPNRSSRWPPFQWPRTIPHCPRSSPCLWGSFDRFKPPVLWLESISWNFLEGNINFQLKSSEISWNQINEPA